MLLPTLRQAVNDPRYTPGQKRLAAEYAARRCAERLARAEATGDAPAAANYRRALALAARIAAEWGDR